MTADSIPVVVKKVVKETDNAKSIFIERKDGLPISYQPGQFLHFGFKQMYETAYRSYSLSTVPEEGVAFTVKEMENGNISRLLQNVQPGEELNLISVGGKFVLPSEMGHIKQVFLFAAGSGITPVYAILKQLLRHYPEVNVCLVYSNSSRRSTIFYDALLALQEQYSHRMSIKFIFSDDSNILAARLSGFGLQELMAQVRKAEWEQVLVYCCGPVSYMDTIKITLFTEGVKAHQFFMEYFDTASDDMMVPPPDKERHRVKVILGGKEHDIEVQYPDTILSVGVNSGIKMPYSCQSGQCGSCTARLKSGEVWLMYNEVLTPDELQQGLILTCMGCPVNGDVVISYDE